MDSLIYGYDVTCKQVIRFRFSNYGNLRTRKE